MPSKRTNAYQGQPKYTQVALHTSAQDLPIPILWGTRRLTPNCIWQLPSGPFNSYARWTLADGMTPAVYGDQEGNNTVIICPGIFGLCEGPIDNPQSLLPGFSAGIVQQSWLGTFQTSPLANQKVGWVYGYGTIGQPLWAYFTQPGIPYPDTNASPLAGVPGPGGTLPYSGVAYVPASGVQL